MLACVSALCLGLAVAEPALAATPPPAQTAPADGAIVRRDAPLTFSGQDPSGPGEIYITISSSPSTDANGALDGAQADAFILAGPSYSFTLHYLSEDYFLSVPGIYHWQLTRTDCDYPDCLALSPVRSFEIRDPIEHSEPIPASAGHQVGASRPQSFVLYGGSRPEGVGLGRLQTIAARSAGRWGVAYHGQTATKPGVADGIHSVGFSEETPVGKLAVTVIFKRNVYSPGKRHCKRRHGHRVCHRGPPRLTATRVVDEDIKIDPGWPWQQGPRYPTDSQFDLESNLIHEFGHFAGNGHVYGCVNSPMIATLAAGDWWHAADDWNRYGCTGVTPAARFGRWAAPASAVVTRYVPPDWRPATR